MPLVLGLSVIISALCSALILFTYYKQSHSRRLELYETLARNCDSGIQYILSQTQPIEKYTELDLYNDQRDSVRLRRMEWGMYDVLAVVAHRGAHRQLKTVMSAMLSDSLHQSSLYLSQSAAPLIVAGDTRLSGTVYVPDGAIRPGAVGGKYFTGKRLLDGTRKTSGGLPELRPGLEERMLRFVSPEQLDRLGWPATDRIPDSLYRSFVDETPSLFRSSGPIDIASDLSGMILIQSSEKITVKEEAKLRNVILLAPVVVVESGFSGKLQVIATQSILIEKEVHLEYPSALVLRPLEGEAKIELGDSTLIQGDILIERNPKNEREGILVMRPGSRLQGYAHVDGGAQVSGSVEGHLSCKSFFISNEGESRGGVVNDATFDHELKAKWLTASGLWQGRGAMIIQTLD